MNIKEILKTLKPLKNRIHLNIILLCVFTSISAAGAITTVLSYLSLLISIPYLLRWIIYIYAAFTVLGIMISVFLRPRKHTLIRTADTLRLKERLVTAWELQNEETKIAQLQRQDTFRKVLETDFKSLYPIKFPKKFAMVITAFIVLTTISFFIPGTAKGSAAQIEKLQDTIDKQLKELEKVTEEFKENSQLKETDLQKILEETERLAKELKKARTEEDALKAMSRAENELEKMDLNKQLNKLSEAFKQFDMTNELGEAIENDSITDVKQALEQLMQQMEQEYITPEELAEMLEQVAEQIENERIAEQLQETSEQLENVSELLRTSSDQATADLTEMLGNSLQNLENLFSNMMQAQQNSTSGQTMGQLYQAMQQAKSRISQVDSSLSANAQTGSSGRVGQNSQNSQVSQGSQGNQNGQNNSNNNQNSQNSNYNGQSNQSNPSSGSGQNQGQGNSSGEGQSSDHQINGAGGGAGKGSTNEDSGYTGGEKSGGGREAGQGYQEEYEQLYIPKHLGGNTDPSYVSGQKQDGGSSSYTQAEQVPVQKGAIRPYNEVLPHYSSEAALYIEKADIPAAMKDIVRQYFESLE